MRKILMAAAVVMGVGACTGAFASDYNNPFGTKTTAYLNFGFGGSSKNTGLLNNLHYGLRMDRNNPYQMQVSNQPARPAFIQADFNLRDGFSGAMLNGVRFASHVKSFDEDSGEETSYSMMDWGLLAVGAVGLGFGIAEVLKTKDDPDPKTTTTTVQTANGPITVIVNTVTGTVQQVLNSAGVPVDVQGLGQTTLNTICGIAKIPGVCLTNDRSSYQNALFMQERDVQREIWLDSGTGQMGDLRPVR